MAHDPSYKTENVDSDADNGNSSSRPDAQNNAIVLSTMIDRNIGELEPTLILK